ncbi:MAG: hypothetical protein AB7O62_08940, partial [Pirellulales bacterium]
LLCVERWGGDDGPDDAIENVNYWPLLHSLGCSNDIRRMYRLAWEGHLRQYTVARTTQVPFAREGMYYKEFPVMMDWFHNAEGATVFNVMGLSDPDDLLLQQRARRFAGFYMNEDPGAPNYDPQHKIIRGMFNGSRGPLLRKATGLDWAGDPIEVEGRFALRHGEESYRDMLAHFQDYNDVLGDHPQNMSATTLATNAFMLDQETKYRDWVLEYVDAWRERMEQNGGIIPTNIGRDGTIGGDAGGNWWGGVYGWGFSVVDPATKQINHRNTHYRGLAGFGNALLLSGDQKYVAAWRKQIEQVNAQGRLIDGQRQYPKMHGEQGWYAFSPAPYSEGALEVWYWSMDANDRKWVPGNLWLEYLDGHRPDYPAQALRGDLETIRRRVAAMRADTTTPDTRLSDDPNSLNPATVQNLLQLMTGGLFLRNQGNVQHSRVRYFDPVARRAGIPPDVAALVEQMTDETTLLTLVNVSQTEPRELIVQTGSYGEHHCTSVAQGEKAQAVNNSHFTVKLAPGTGAKLQLHHRRYANAPTLAHPW